MKAKLEYNGVVTLTHDDGSVYSFARGDKAGEDALLEFLESGGVLEPYALPPATDRRAARYRSECDPLLLATYGYQIEIDAETDPTARAKLEQKQAKAKADYLAAKRRIREEIPDVAP